MTRVEAKQYAKKRALGVSPKDFNKFTDRNLLFSKQLIDSFLLCDDGVAERRCFDSAFKSRRGKGMGEFGLY